MGLNNLLGSSSLEDTDSLSISTIWLPKQDLHTTPVNITIGFYLVIKTVKLCHLQEIDSSGVNYIKQIKSVSDKYCVSSLLWILYFIR